MISTCMLSCLSVDSRSENPCIYDVWWQRETNSSRSESLHELAWVRRFLHSLALFFFVQAVMIMKKDLSWSIVLILLVWRMSFFYCAPHHCITFELVELCMCWCVELPCITTHSSHTLPVVVALQKGKSRSRPFGDERGKICTEPPCSSLSFSLSYCLFWILVHVLGIDVWSIRSKWWWRK